MENIRRCCGERHPINLPPVRTSGAPLSMSLLEAVGIDPETKGCQGFCCASHGVRFCVSSLVSLLRPQRALHLCWKLRSYTETTPETVYAAFKIKAFKLPESALGIE